MAFVNRIKRWLNKTTGGATVTDYALNEINLNSMVDDIERMITVYTDVFADVIASGGLETGRSGLTNNITKCVAYGKKRRVEQVADTVGHVYTVSKDTYVHLNTLTSDYAFYEVANLAAAPALGTDEIAVAKVVTDATVITGYTVLNRNLNLVPSVTYDPASNVVLKDALNRLAQNLRVDKLFPSYVLEHDTAFNGAFARFMTRGFGTGDAIVSQNAYVDGSNVWQRDDVAEPSTILTIDEGLVLARTAAGSGPITFTNLMTVSPGGILGTVQVPISLIGTAVPLDVGATNAEGVSPSVARADHVHSGGGLDSQGITMTNTFTSLLNNGLLSFNFTHGLGVDNVKVIMAVSLSAGSSLGIGLTATRPDGMMTAMRLPAASEINNVVLIPSSGSVNVHLRNSSSSTITGIISVTIIKET